MKEGRKIRKLQDLIKSNYMKKILQIIIKLNPFKFIIGLYKFIIGFLYILIGLILLILLKINFYFKLLKKKKLGYIFIYEVFKKKNVNKYYLNLHDKDDIYNICLKYFILQLLI